MGIRGMSITSIILILLVVLLVFGSKRLRGVGEDLGNALKGFRKGIRDHKKNDDKES